ncbi:MULTISPECIES: hydrogenase subunit MbhD domain-containing protein [unclassified Mycobacterium]|uniref:Na(+)/H(+) antiporter subunit B n=1 Tax=unclassified Mycobacterium TaxID=2642494 RepID=UPI00041707EA|nr:MULTISPECIES: hydrogenase subunit MbhD domain-containing protein [unclassified Mycobacterium]
MTTLVLFSLTTVGIIGTIVALTGEPQRQAIMLSVFGLALTVLFVLLQAPDVALSQLLIGGVVVPLMVMLTVRTVQRRHREIGR